MIFTDQSPIMSVRTHSNSKFRAMAKSVQPSRYAIARNPARQRPVNLGPKRDAENKSQCARDCLRRTRVRRRPGKAYACTGAEYQEEVNRTGHPSRAARPLYAAAQ
jgi:hypothetical protein